VPVISAVGHEVDFTIADFVADIRASTPRRPPKLVVEKEQAFAERIDNLVRRAQQTARFAVQERRQDVPLPWPSTASSRISGSGLFGLDQRVDLLEIAGLGTVRGRQRQMADAKARAVLAEERMGAILYERSTTGRAGPRWPGSGSAALSGPAWPPCGRLGAAGRRPAMPRVPWPF